MRTSFSWDRAFFTSDGFLAAEEFSSMIEGGGGDGFNHELQKIDELESLEAKLFQEFEASTQTSKLTDSTVNSSSGKAKKVTGAGGSHRDAPIKTPPTRSSPLSGGSGGSPGNNVKTLAIRSMSSKTGKGNADAPSKTPPGITTKNKVVSVNTRISRTSPASPVSPVSPGSSSSTFAVNQQSKTKGGAPHRSPVNVEKPSATNARRNDDRKASKPAVSLMPKTQSSISSKIKPPPVISHPTSPLGKINSSSSSTTQRPSESSSCTVDQRSKSRNTKGSTVHHISKPTLKNHPTGQTSDLNRKQPAKTAAASNTGLKPDSPKATSPKKQSSAKAKASGRSSENIFVISPEILDLKGKINALKMEISMHKKDRCNKTARAESDEGNLKTTFAIKECSL